MSKTAFITGITGQDGALLARFLLDKGYAVHGMRQWSATDNTQNIADLIDGSPDFYLHLGDLTDMGSMTRLLGEVAPDEIYNLGAQTHVGDSFEIPEMTADVNALGTLRLLEAMRLTGLDKTARFYQASSSELFGNAPAPQNENTPMNPCSPYACAKQYAYNITRNYREAYGMHASNGILFNHESQIRGEHFVTRKITKAVAAISLGLQDCLMLGNLGAKRDWGHARDYVEGMWLMLQQDTPDDYVLATGEAHSVREFVERAFSCTGRTIVWAGDGVDETGTDPVSGKTVVRVDPALFRPAELHSLLGDASKAREILGWRPRTGFDALVREMMRSDGAELAGGNLTWMQKAS